jgi:uncharacterized short protein YbdD (DUF466 family)
MKSHGSNPSASDFGLADQVRRIGKVVRTIIGAPDYERYVAHVRKCHPEQTVMSRDEFAKNRLDARSSQPGNRCC